MSNVKIIQLQTGQFLVGDCDLGDDGTVVIKEPFEVTLQPVQTPQGVQPQVGMFPYAPFINSREFTYTADQIQLNPAEADENCANYWRQATSGLAMAKAGDLPPDPPEKKGGSGLVLQG